jgi:polygalacturonase
MYNVKDFGASGVGTVEETIRLESSGYKWISYSPGLTANIRHAVKGGQLDSVGIQRALDAAHGNGGGTVFVPPGDYIVGPLLLRSYVRLHLESGARLWASPRLEDYRNQTNLLLAVNSHNLSITGEGEIHGQSPQWLFPWLNEGPTDWQSLNTRRPGRLILFDSCNHVSVRGIRIYDSPTWTLVFERCKHVAVCGVFMRHTDIINADGIDIVDSSHVTISDCNLHVTDDAICFKNKTADAPGVRNVAVTNCVIRTLCNAVKIGTESDGVFENIAVSNIVVHNPNEDFKYAEGGINIALCDGGSVRNVIFNNFVMDNVECPFYLVSTPRKSRRKTDGVVKAGTIENISISNIRADGYRYTPFVVGCPDVPIRGIELSDIHIRKTAEFRDAPFGVDVPECDQQYPTPFMFGSPSGGQRGCGDGLPAYGLYLRDVDGLRARNFTVDSTGEDCRQLRVQERCRNIEFI